MYRRMIGILIITVLLAGCSTEAVSPEETPIQEETIIGAGEEAKEVSSVQGNGETGEVENWVMVPVGEEPGNGGDGQRQENVLISQEQAVRLFLDAWEHNDLEKMDMLTLQPLEEFFRQSHMNFASYRYLDNGDLAGFVRDGIGKLKDYNIDTFDNARIENPLPNGDRLKVGIGDYLNLDVMLVLDRNMWKLNAMEASLLGFEEAVPQDWDTLGQLVLADLKDMDGDGSHELLAIGTKGEWEGIGPEPTSAIGIYTYSGGKIANLYYSDMNDRLENGRVVTEGGMGRVLEGHPAVLVLIEKTAQDNLAVIEGPETEYYVSIYSLENGRLKKVGEIDWKGAVSEVLGSRIKPEWVELLGVKSLKRGATESVVLRVGFRYAGERDHLYQTNEGIFVLSHDGTEWYIDWYHEGTFGEYHTVVFEEAVDATEPIKFYYIEDMPLEEEDGGGVFEVSYRNGRWYDIRIFEDKLSIKAAGDMDGDGVAEFLVFDGRKLEVHSRDGEVMAEISLPRDTREVPFAWIGAYGGRQRIAAALHLGDYVNMNSEIHVWEGEDYKLQDTWQSETLGSDGITAMIVRDINRNGKPDILANYTNDYLVLGQYFKIFEP